MLIHRERLSLQREPFEQSDGVLQVRQRRLDSSKKIAVAQALYNAGTYSINDIRQTLGISPTILYPRSTSHPERRRSEAAQRCDPAPTQRGECH